MKIIFPLLLYLGILGLRTTTELFLYKVFLKSIPHSDIRQKGAVFGLLNMTLKS